MGQFNLVQHGTLNVDGEVIPVGSATRSHSFSFTKVHAPLAVTVAASGKATLLDIVGGQTGNAGGSYLSSFSVLLICSDRDVVIEEIVDEGNEVGQRIQSWTCKGSGTANEMGPMHPRFSDVAYASDHTENFGAGTLDKIETIRVQNTDSTNAAQVRLIACA